MSSIQSPRTAPPRKKLTLRQNPRGQPPRINSVQNRRLSMTSHTPISEPTNNASGNTSIAASTTASATCAAKMPAKTTATKRSALGRGGLSGKAGQPRGIPTGSGAFPTETTKMTVERASHQRKTRSTGKMSCSRPFGRGKPRPIVIFVVRRPRAAPHVGWHGAWGGVWTDCAFPGRSPHNVPTKQPFSAPCFSNSPA